MRELIVPRSQRRHDLLLLSRIEHLVLYSLACSVVTVSPEHSGVLLNKTENQAQ
jgi:hypothetical protein